MFKKLKQKLEEGGEGRLESVSFTPSKLPGSVIRSGNDEKNESQSPQTPVQPQTLSEPELQSQTLEWDEQKDEIPSHLSFQPHLSYQSVLEARVKRLEQEKCGLNEQLNELSETNIAEQSRLQERTLALDKQLTELKMQIVEAEIEKAAIQRNHKEECQELLNKMTKLEEQSQQDYSNWTNQLSQLKKESEEKDKCIIEAENKYRELEKKASHFESQLKAYESASENLVVTSLHSEVADVEQRVQSRNLEIQILERRLAAQNKEKEEEFDRLITRQEELDRINKELRAEIREERAARRELMKQVEKEQHESANKDREKAELKALFDHQAQAQQRLAREMEYLQSSHTKRVQDMDDLILEKDSHIKELKHQLKQLQGENLLLEPISRPPGMARRTTSIGIQTTFCEAETEPAILPIESTDVGPAATDSEDALKVTREQKCQLEEELTEKIKIIKVQQQKIMDMRKELRSQKTSDLPEENARQRKHTPSPPPKFAIASDVNFQYLKHVVIKFMCSREDEALQLVRAVSTLLEFSPQEEQHIKNYLSYRMSWFGVVPPPLFTPVQPV